MITLSQNSVSIGEVYAMHLEGDASPKGHRYHLSPEIEAAHSIDIYTVRKAKDLKPESICIISEEGIHIRIKVVAAFDLRVESLVKAQIQKNTAPNQAPQTTIMADTPAATHPSRQP